MAFMSLKIKLRAQSYCVSYQNCKKRNVNISVLQMAYYIIRLAVIHGKLTEREPVEN